MSPETSKAENASSNHPETTSRKFCRRWNRQGGAAALSPRHGSAAASPKEKREVLSAVLWRFFCCFFNYVHCRACLCQTPFHDAGGSRHGHSPITALTSKAQTDPRLHPAGWIHSSTSTCLLTVNWDELSPLSAHQPPHTCCSHSRTSRLAVPLLNRNTAVSREGTVTNRFRQRQQLCDC